MATEPLLLVAASGLARETLAAMRAGGLYHAVGLLDDKPEMHGTAVDGVGILGPLDLVDVYRSVRIVVCAGSGTVRSLLVDRLRDLGVDDGRFATVLHPAASMPAECGVGPGSVLLANVTLTADASVGSHVVAMPNVTITHDDVIEDFVTLCAGVSIGGGVRVGSSTYIGMNASVRQRVTVGSRCVIGMGAVVLNDLADDAVVVGNPARALARRTVIGAQRSGSGSETIASRECR